MKIHSESGKERQKQIKILYDFISAHKLAVMATVTSNVLPEAAVIGIAVTKDMELVCSTFSTSRKYGNLKKNPSVALVIGWEQGKTVQYEGTVKELSEGEAEEHLEKTLAKTPAIGKYLQREHRVLYKITPKWIRFSDLSIDPWERFEIKF